MKADILITADIHVSSQPRDEYRWLVFPWLKKIVAQYKIKHLCIIGDLTEAKDGHSSALVNRLVREIVDLSNTCAVYILKGNHDYVDEDQPFFGFLDHLENVCFFSKPEEMIIAKRHAMFLPHTKRWRSAWVETGLDLRGFDFIFLHQMFDGCRAENGHVLQGGVPPSFFSKKIVGDAKVVSGDIHTPQMVENITYVGAPHPVDFGDDWEPRVLVVNEDNQLITIKRTTIKKLIVDVTTTDLENLAAWLEQNHIGDDDQLRLRFTLPRSQFCEWQKLQQESAALLQKRGAILCGCELREKTKRIKLMESATDMLQGALTRSKIFDTYCEVKGIEPQVQQLGKDIVKELSDAR